MKSILTASLSALLLLSGPAQALDPVPGLYAGIFVGGTMTPPATLHFIHPLTLGPTSGKLNYSYYGDIGGELGYRYNQFRMESELLFNQSPFRKFTIGDFQVTNSKSSGIRFSGFTRTAALMINGIFDAYSIFDQTCYVPYVGIGIGYARVQNSVKLFNNNVVIPGTSLSNHQNGGAAQFILGLNYFMDDFTTIGLDYRYFTAKQALPITTRNTFNAINLSFTGSFDLG